MAQSVQELRGWLLQQPRPHKLRVITTDDQHHEVAVSSGVSWMAIAQSIRALEPALIEAYDPEGKILRAVRPLEQGHESASGSTPLPLSLPPGADPNCIMLIHFSDLLAAAYRHASDVAFERLVGMFEQANRRTESLERSLELSNRMMRRTLEQQLEDAAEPPAKDPDLLRDMVGNFLTAAQASTNGTTNGSPNGKGGAT